MGLIGASEVSGEWEEEKVSSFGGSPSREPMLERAEPRRRTKPGVVALGKGPGVGRGSTLHAYLVLAAARAEREEREAGGEEEEKVFQKAKLVLPHLGLVLLCVCYTLAGGLAFYWVERPYEEGRRGRGLARVGASREALLRELWGLAEGGAGEAEWKARAEGLVDGLSRELFAAFEERYVTAELLLASPENRSLQPFHWTFPSAVFFSATTITTIGYGNLVPRTPTGRAICVVFGLFGIPLMLVTIADMGKFIGDGLQVVWERWQVLRRNVRLGWRSGRRSPEMVLPPLQMKIPTQLIVLMIVGYTALGGLLLPLWELHWDFWDSSYFSFITMATIGFGDCVPRNEAAFWATLLYILLGLALTTMGVDLVGTHYIQKIHYFGRKIQNARDALKTVGDLVRYTHFLRRKYTGVGDAELRRLMVGTDWEEFLHSAAPFTPRDAARFPYIDQTPGSRSLSTRRSILSRVSDPLSAPSLPPPSPPPPDGERALSLDTAGERKPSSVFDIPLPSIDDSPHHVYSLPL